MIPVYLTVATDAALMLPAMCFLMFSKRKITRKNPNRKLSIAQQHEEEQDNLHPFLSREPVEAHEFVETPEI